MPYRNVDIFREKGLKVFQKCLGATEFYEKMGKCIRGGKFPQYTMLKIFIISLY
jgi:hypothetical protein